MSKTPEFSLCKELTEFTRKTRHEQFVGNVVGWAAERQFRDGALLPMQMLKLGEEKAEMMLNVVENQVDGALPVEMLEDDIGDQFVVLIVIAHMLDADPQAVYPYYDTDAVIKPERLDLSIELLRLDAHYGKLCRAICKNLPKADLIELCAQYSDRLHMICRLIGTELIDCLAVAYSDIADRKGKWINGSFVKEADLENN